MVTKISFWASIEEEQFRPLRVFAKTLESGCKVWGNFNLMKIKRFGPHWVHMVRNGPISKQDDAM